MNDLEWPVEERCDSGRKRLGDSQRIVHFCDDLIDRRHAPQPARLAMHKLPADEIQAPLLPRAAHDDQPGFALHFQELQESKQRDPRNASDRGRAQQTLQLVDEHGNVDGLGERRGNPVAM